MAWAGPRLVVAASSLRIALQTAGKAEMLVRIVEKYGVKGVGLDLSPHFIRDAESKKRERVSDADLRFIEIDGAE